MSEPYTAADLAKELRKVIATLEQPVSVDLAEVKGMIDALDVGDHENSRSAPEDLLRSVSRAESAIDTASNARKEAREAISGYIETRFAPDAGSVTGSKSDNAGSGSIPAPPSAPSGAPYPDGWAAFRDSNAAAAPSTRESREASRASWRSKVREWLSSARDRLLPHAQTIDSVFLLFDAYSDHLGLLIPVLDPLVGGLAKPTWFAVQLGMTTASYAWALLKDYGEDNQEWSRSVETAKFLVSLHSVLVPEELSVVAELPFVHDLCSYVYDYIAKPLSGPDENE